MNKTIFEKIVAQKAEDQYQEKKRVLLELILKFFDDNREMNAHNHGNSARLEVHNLVNSYVEKRKEEIIPALESKIVNGILTNLKDVKFLFETPAPSGESGEMQ